jgi:hypothetical protein
VKPTFTEAVNSVALGVIYGSIGVRIVRIFRRISKPPRGLYVVSSVELVPSKIGCGSAPSRRDEFYYSFTTQGVPNGEGRNHKKRKTRANWKCSGKAHCSFWLRFFLKNITMRFRDITQFLLARATSPQLS